MEQTELIKKIKLAFEKVHKKIGVFQAGELDEMFKEEEKTALEFIGKSEEPKEEPKPEVHKGDEKNARK